MYCSFHATLKPQRSRNYMIANSFDSTFHLKFWSHLYILLCAFIFIDSVDCCIFSSIESGRYLLKTKSGSLRHLLTRACRQKPYNQKSRHYADLQAAWKDIRALSRYASDFVAWWLLPDFLRLPWKKTVIQGNQCFISVIQTNDQIILFV